jgi:hypothetical protein
MAASKRQTTHAKLAREQKIREKRALKQEKKDDRKWAAANPEAAAEAAARAETEDTEPAPAS